jgi:hypothetical protein
MKNTIDLLRVTLDINLIEVTEHLGSKIQGLTYQKFSTA